MNELIRIENLTKTYFLGDIRVEALKGINLKINTGDFISIMGSSGSGKSTLMNILGCLDLPTSGNYYFKESNIAKMEKDELSFIRNREIGFVFQNFNLLSRTSSLENVEIPLIYNGLNSTKRNEMATSALELVGLEDRKYHLPTQLSGGQQQRVAIARAIVNDPGLILADEPTGNLDSKTSYEIIKIFEKLNEQGRTIVMITHEKDIASFAKRKVVIKDGLIESNS
ncbi:MAG: ABC transporter ATP-binding protein [Thermodesulfobacteriota bacterium]